MDKEVKDMEVFENLQFEGEIFFKLQEAERERSWQVNGIPLKMYCKRWKLLFWKQIFPIV